jgi:hypothetical protein
MSCLCASKQAAGHLHHFDLDVNYVNDQDGKQPAKGNAHKEVVRRKAPLNVKKSQLYFWHRVRGRSRAYQNDRVLSK